MRRFAPAPVVPGAAPRTGGRGLRMKPGQMNKTERERADQLEALVASGAIIGWWFQPFRLRLAEDNAYYAIDFMVLYPDGRIELEEIKGFFEEAALVRIKVAATVFPFTFVALTKQPKKLGGGWARRQFKGWSDPDHDTEPRAKAAPVPTPMLDL